MIERKIVIGVIVNDEFITEIAKIPNVIELLESQAARRLMVWCLEYFKKYKKAPGKDIEQIYFDKLKTDKSLPKELAEEIEQDILPDLSDEYEDEGLNVKFLLDQSIKHFRQRQAEILLDKQKDALDRGDIELYHKLRIEFKPIQLSDLEENKLLTGKDLFTMEIKEPGWLIRDLIPKGLTVFGGKSKLGKSYFTMNVVLNLVQGKRMFENETFIGFKGSPGNVLYLALEDKNRAATRARQIEKNPNEKRLEQFNIVYDWDKLAITGLDQIEEWIKNAPRPKLVVIDTIAKVWSKSAKTSGGGLYAEEYKIYGPLGDLANKYDISIIAITHTTKSKAADVFDEILGGSGMQGPTDNLLIMTKTPDGKRLLSVRGKDTEEKHLLFDVSEEGAKWECLGEVGEVQKSIEQQSIYDYLEAAGEWMSYNEIRRAAKDGEINVSQNSINTILRKMIEAGKLVQDKPYGKYQIAGLMTKKVNFGIAKNLHRTKQ